LGAEDNSGKQAAARCIVKFYARAVALRGRFHDREAEAAPPLIATEPAIETRKYPLAVCRGNSGTGVGDFKDSLAFSALHTDVHAAAARCVTDRVVGEIAYQHAQRIRIAAERHLLCASETEVHASRVGERRHLRHSFARSLVEARRNERALRSIRIAARERKELVNEMRRSLDAGSKLRLRGAMLLRIRSAIEELDLQPQSG
jgi:hypothetical protein